MTDALVAALGNAGLQPVFLPHTGFVPPDLYTYLPGSVIALKPRARLVRHGPMSHYLRKGAHPLTAQPKPTEYVPIKGVHTSKKNVGASIHFLTQVLVCLGVPALPKIDTDIDLGDSLIFAFDGVTGLSCDLSEIETRAKDFVFHGIPTKQVEAGLVHVVYEYVYARQLLMKRGDSTKFKTGIDGKIGDWLSLGKASIDVTIKDDLTITFTAKKNHAPPAFAYRSAQIVQQGSAFAVNAHVTLAGGESEKKPKYVPHPTDVLFVTDEENRDHST